MSNFKIATKDDVKNAGFVFVKDVNTQEVKKIATSADFQVGLSNLPKDLTVTGKATFTQGLSGSLTRLTDDTSYLVAGGNITITSASNGQITITGAGGSGDVVGPASATDNAIARFNLATGKLIQDSAVTIADTTGNITTPGDIAVNGGDITTSSATFNLVNDATTINLGSTAITRAINIGTNATNVQTINIGTGAAANIISIGSATGAASLTLQSGTGNIALSGGNSTTYTIGTSSTTGTITIGQSTDTNTINIGNGATASTKTQTINVGNSTASGGITNINIGAASNGTNTITIGKFGGGSVNVILGGDDVQIGDNALSDVGFFGTTPQPKTSVTDITNSVTSGGTANTLSNYTSLTTYSTDAAAIRGNFYQIGLKLNAIIDALQSYGLI